MLDNPFNILTFYGAEGQNRTADTGIFSPLLYRLSYLGVIKTRPKKETCLCIKSSGNCQDFFVPYRRKEIAAANMPRSWLFRPLRYVGPGWL